MHSYHIHITGLVQGVGFRPFIYRIANEMRLTGEVRNNNEGVCIELESTEEEKDKFIQRIRNEKPLAATIDTVIVKKEERRPFRKDFTITASNSVSSQITHVSPDIAVCKECLADMKRQSDRISYPFINCTHCGPRFTIIRDLPYDRSQTSMHEFRMCQPCYEEYVNVDDRRFHAQPTACNTCGPFYYTSELSEEGELQTNYSTPDRFFKRIASHIQKGEVLSLKGLGGYNLVCDAFSPIAVHRLRQIKQRDAKPFALMFRSEKEAEKYAYISPEEHQQLTSWQRPIVLLKLKEKLDGDINGELHTIGIMLPYLPAHYLLFEQLQTNALVFTSGNLSDEPIIIDTHEAHEKLLPLCKRSGDHNRQIVNRADDSVVQVINHLPRLMRRSRGYVPNVHRSSLYLDGILAFGPEKVNTFAIGKENEAILSQYIGDLKNKETTDFYREAMECFGRLFRFTPRLLVCDMHPDYYSSQYAARMARELHLELYQVQHHHAHAVACMEENGITGNHLAIVLDGTGYGTDGNIWGGEFLICNHQAFTREAHLDYVPLPGGDKAIREPWRSATSFLEHYQLQIPQQFADRHMNQINLIQKMIRQRINSPLSSGAGRLFDAVSALLGCCDYASFQAEAPLRLEHLAEAEYRLTYPIDELNPLNCCSVLNAICNDISLGVRRGLIAAKFHNTFVRQLVMQTHKILREKELPKEVVLTGGCFQNKRLSEQLETELTQAGIRPVVPQRYPANDGGIALGQISIAATLRKREYA